MTTPQQATTPAPAAPVVDPQAKIIEHLAAIRASVAIIATTVVLGTLGVIVVLIAGNQG